jgi:hypothetical protein
VVLKFFHVYVSLVMYSFSTFLFLFATNNRLHIFDGLNFGEIGFVANPQKNQWKAPSWCLRHIFFEINV